MFFVLQVHLILPNFSILFFKIPMYLSSAHFSVLIRLWDKSRERLTSSCLENMWFSKFRGGADAWQPPRRLRAHLNETKWAVCLV
jgi:hypothetical protein